VKREKHYWYILQWLERMHYLVRLLQSARLHHPKHLMDVSYRLWRCGEWMSTSIRVDCIDGSPCGGEGRGALLSGRGWDCSVADWSLASL
jgi:hypothetical protein